MRLQSNYNPIQEHQYRFPSVLFMVPVKSPAVRQSQLIFNAIQEFVSTIGVHFA